MEVARHIAVGLAMAAASLHVQWHDSAALGTYSAGSLTTAVKGTESGGGLPS
jgi:hypothetical protein